jgi:hypothetical protein
MRAVRALGRLRWLLAAIAVPATVAALGVGIQAAAFSRPPHDVLVATGAVQDLLRFRVMRATEVLGRRRLHATCLQGWFRPRHHRRAEAGALVLLGNGVKLYSFGRGIHRVGRRGVATRADLARFLLAGCPRYIGDRVGAQLVSSRWVDTDPSHVDGSPTLELAFGRHAAPIELFINLRTRQPMELRLSGFPARGWSDLTPGGGAASIARVRRAFDLPTRPKHSA